MAELEYEQPLNEKVRVYLRLEFLSQQLKSNLANDFKYRCFYPLFALCELTERGDSRMDIIKDIEKQIRILVKYLDHPDIDRERTTGLLEDLNLYRENLQSHDRPGAQLKKDRFLMALKQRFNMPGACCNFDLPQLHFWLGQDWEIRKVQYQQWQSHFQSILKPVELLLKLTRKPSEFVEQAATAGFYQGTDEHSLSLIRVKVDTKQGCYPTISGHRNRYAIHFVDFEQQQHTDKTIAFRLATCR